ncbi:hypothetical protein M2191_004854 [Bradyrhizobium japonicum]|nr:hypothetical protein [Bradyrhizobium japonicum]
MRAVVPESFVPFMAAFPESAPRVARNVQAATFAVCISKVAKEAGASRR